MDPHAELISMQSIVGGLLGGFGVKIAAAAGVVWIAYEAFTVLSQMATPVAGALAG